MPVPDDTDNPHRMNVVEADAAADTGDSKAPVSGTEETSGAYVPSYPVVEKAEGTDNIVEVSPRLPPAEAANSSRSDDNSPKLGRRVEPQRLQPQPTPDGASSNSVIEDPASTDVQEESDDADDSNMMDIASGVAWTTVTCKNTKRK